SNRSCGYRCTPHELDTSAVRIPALRAARTASTIAVSGWTPANKPSISPSESTPNSSAKLYSKSDSSIVPFSSDMSSSRNWGSALKRLPSSAGSISLRVQNSPKEVNRLVVRTPPQSISRPRRPLVAVLCKADAPRALACVGPAVVVLCVFAGADSCARAGPSFAESPTERHPLGLAGQLEHALPELLQVGIVGRTGHGALVVALHEHHRLPQSERRVPAQLPHRASRELLVARDQLCPRRVALGAGNSA